MLQFIFIWCSLLFCGSYAVVPLEEFFAYGGENGDERLAYKNIYYMIGHVDHLDPPYTIFGKTQNFLNVNDDGCIEFENGKISIMRAYISLRKVGDVYWRESKSQADLDKARKEIGSAFLPYQTLDLKWVVIATWYRVSRSAEKARNTFQFILTTDGIRSFVIFYYNNIEWYIENYSTAGFEMKKHGGWYSNPTIYRYFINGSHSHDMLTIGNRSNCGSPGKWIFRIDKTTIYGPNSVCAMPPQPENGVCIAEELTRGSLARCNCTHGCKLYKEEFLLECSASAENETVDWIGNMPECRPLNESITECHTRFSHQCPTRPSSQCSSCQPTTNLPSSTNSSVKLCPLPPIPQNGECDKLDYFPGSSAKCRCLPSYRNINPNSQLYCVFAEDENLFWSGGTPVCVNTSV